jgi:hypothetical protein
MFFSFSREPAGEYIRSAGDRRSWCASVYEDIFSLDQGVVPSRDFVIFAAGSASGLASAGHSSTGG